jgi:hypothetical protein
MFTQIGGVVYVLALFLFQYITKHSENAATRFLLKISTLLLLYLAATFFIVPPLAKVFGRERLPLTETNHLRPLNILTCILNRNYVRPTLKQAAYNVAAEMNKKYPGTIVNYLDGCFPFINNFPLVPHLSHNDGRKLDLAFCYIENNNNQPSNNAPSFIGYGISEEPRVGEENTALDCEEKGFWQYSLLKKLVPQTRKKNFTFDSTRTAMLVNLFIAQPAIGKIFIEPHLKTRLHLTSDKIRFHGCRAVRHDDHIHVQLSN